MAVPPKPGGARACCAVRGRARCLVSMLLLWMLPLSLLVCSRACCSCLRACDAPADAVRLLRRRLAAGAVDGRMLSKFSGPFSREFQLFFFSTLSLRANSRGVNSTSAGLRLESLVGARLNSTLRAIGSLLMLILRRVESVHVSLALP